jgi:ATP-dependent Clp protease adaptor protein ClpS
MSAYIEVEEDIDLLVQELFQYAKNLIIYNDDFNTFEHVIDALVKVCDHNPLQAEQCTWIIHNNGKCQVKRGEYDRLEPMCIALLDRGITATIE